jgi:hypothetical protein
MPQPRLYQTRAEQQAAYRRRLKSVQADLTGQKGLPPLPAIPSMPGKARWRAAMEHAYALLEQTVKEMQHYYDNRSEQWRESPKADDLQEQIDNIQDFAGQLQETASLL